MRIKLILRLILAITFAALAVIFSELIPPIEGVNPFISKFFVTVLSGAIGFLVFPDIATKVTSMTLHLFNFVINRLAAETSSQFLRLSRQHSLPLVGTTAQISGISLQRPLILDTSALIDGRVLDIAKTSFLFGTVLIPSFVLTELQQVADSSDFLKRSRGRRGFEVIEELKKVKGIRVEIWDKGVTGRAAVDDRLVQLAKNLHGRIITTDFNLNRVATAASVAVLNINELANSLKTIAIPGEKLKIKIMHLGKDSTQGVGYLADGTMLVIQDGASQVGKEIEIEVTKMLQIPAGRMIFAKRV